MSILRPFRALRPHPAQVSKVAAVPYDVVSRDEARTLAEGNPLSFLHVSRPEIDFKDSIYTLQMGEHVQSGIVGTFSLQEYEDGVIKKHEKTRQDKEDDRTRHTLELGAQTGPVYLVFRDHRPLLDAMSRVQQSTPLYSFTAEDGIKHSLWRVVETDDWVRMFQEFVPELYIADGHHRAAAASRVRKRLLESAGAPDAPWNYFLGVAFPGSQLKIFPYHRVVKDLGNLQATEFLFKVQQSFEIVPGDSSIPAFGEVGMFFENQWYRLKNRLTEKFDLDVDLLQNLILRPILGIHDPRVDSRLEFVGGIRGTQELERLVSMGKARVAFSLHPTDLAQVMSVSDRGEIMPPKSTWFEPKLRDGIFCHLTQNLSDSSPLPG
ncbi:MAG: DUF1015 domain-containing protein [Bdellovibrio sp.]|nr:DUF1015 domain-containing protein [Bdellovibrio sp.]